MVPPVLQISADKKLWVFNWDEKGGGSGQYCYTIIVYTGGEKPLLYDMGGAEHGEMPFTLYKIHSHPGEKGAPMYVLEMGNETGGIGSYEVYMIPMKISGMKIQPGPLFVFDKQNGDRYDSKRGIILHPDGTQTVVPWR